jgi:hypothetical protein
MLAVIGFVAVLRLLAVALLRLLGRGVEVFLAREVSAQHARRGDLSALRAAETAQASATRARLGAIAWLALLTALLAAPPFTPWTRELYAVYAPLWLLTSPRLARRRV